VSLQTTGGEPLPDVLSGQAVTQAIRGVGGINKTSDYRIQKIE
jgi:hypothetical protein